MALFSSRHEQHYFSFKLEFDGTNNVAEYEALLLGINVAKYYSIQ